MGRVAIAGIEPLIGRRLDGATLTPVDERGGLATPTWGPAAFLRDLELRLGLPRIDVHEFERVDAWSRRLAAHLTDEPFYAASYRADPLGTSTLLLRWRDELVTSGWNGAGVTAGGPRLDAFTTLETTAPDLPAGEADRLAAVERALVRWAVPLYRSITLADSIAAWPHRWRRVLARLRALGAAVRALDIGFDGAPAGSDLHALQASLRSLPGTPPPIRGDGSIALITAPTAIEAADAAAALLASFRDQDVVVVRAGEHGLLDGALRAHGLPTMGVGRPARWRAALQLLPLALELAFDPPDAHRTLELLSLPLGPFTSRTRRALSRALADAPGIGGPVWQRACARLRDRAGDDPDQAAAVEEQLAAVSAWIEGARHDPTLGAPRPALLAVVARVRDWLAGRRHANPDDIVVHAAEAHAALLAAAIERDPRERLDLLEVRQLVDAVTAEGTSVVIEEERAGRIEHVDHPAALLTSRDTVVWWHFIAGSESRPVRSPWRLGELAALASADVVLDDAAAALGDEAAAWRRAVLAARHRLVLVAPDTIARDRVAPHPFWDEILARLARGGAAAARLAWTVEHLGPGSSRRPPWAPPVEVAPVAPLPPPRLAWTVAPGAIEPRPERSPRSVQALLDCPLRWVLTHAASLRPGTLATIPDGPLLNGRLAHRLVETLVQGGALTAPDADLRAAALAALDAILPTDAAPLLQPGMRLELLQLREQLVRAVTALGHVLRSNGMEVVAVEEAVEVPWLGGQLVGRIDLVARSADGREVILDLKWGRRTYREQLAEGRAVQLALYAEACRRRSESAAVPAAGYVVISRGETLTTGAPVLGGASRVDGPDLAETLRTIEVTVPLIEAAIARGTVAVTGVDGAPTLAETVAGGRVPREHLFDTPAGSGCGDCAYGAVCGRSWEGLS